MGRGWVALFKVPQQVLDGPGIHISTAEAVMPLCFGASTFGPPWDNNTHGLRAYIPMAGIQALSPTHCISLGRVSPGGIWSGQCQDLGHWCLWASYLWPQRPPWGLQMPSGFSCAGHIMMVSHVWNGLRKGPPPRVLKYKKPSPGLDCICSSKLL